MTAKKDKKPKNISELIFEPSGFFAVRSPLLPFDTLLEWTEGVRSADLACKGASEHELLSALSEDKKNLREKLREICMDPVMSEAIFVASPSLAQSFDKWLADPESKRGQKVERSLVKYVTRSSARPTPFGLFSGCSVGECADATALELGPRSDNQRHTRLDHDYLFALTEALGNDPRIRASLRYWPNSSLYRTGESVHYAEARLRGRARTYHLVEVEASEYLLATLDRAAEGAYLCDLAETLVRDDPEITLVEASEFISELVDSQILASQLSPALTGSEAIFSLIDLLSTVECARPLVETLCDVRDKLSAIDAQGLGVPQQRYHEVVARLETLPPNVEVSRLFQVDMNKPLKRALLGSKPLEEIFRGMDILHQITSKSQDVLASFREAFSKRYEEREVPLVEVLDEEMGIGFGQSSAENTPLLQGVALGAPAREQTAQWSSRYNILPDKLQDIAREGKQELELTQEDIQRMSVVDRAILPDAFMVLASIAASSAEAVDQGDFRLFFSGLYGPSGARLLGRFCHADPDLERGVKGHLRAEEQNNEDAIYAEIVHLPEGRMGNVISRPVLRDYEIVFLGISGAAKGKQIPITDLYVSVIGGRVILRSKNLDREIIPRMTNAHNYTQGQGIYRFLGSLQSQAVDGMGWSWGALDSLRFLPRVSCGRLVFQRARWWVGADELRDITAQKKSSARFEAVQKWRERRRLPRFVVLPYFDNELPVDLDNVLSVENFIDMVKNQSNIRLTELIPTQDELIATSEEGRFRHELVVPFVRKPQPDAQDEGHRSRAFRMLKTKADYQRSFAPGSEWLYAKLYCGTCTADTVLSETIAPFAREVQDQGLVDKWFFLRYGDPDHHLRVRFFGESEKLTGDVLPRFMRFISPFLKSGGIWRVQYDTYEREMRRYGGDQGIELSETIFHIDSEAVVQLLSMLEGDEGAKARWQLALLGVDFLLDDIGFGLDTKQRFVDQTLQQLAGSFNLNSVTSKRQLGNKFRQERKTFEELYAGLEEPQHELAPGFSILHKRSARLRPALAELKEINDHMNVSLDELMRSYIHMHVNRLMHTAQREQEIVLYDLLNRRYRSLIARMRKSKQR
jgi:thiopeptide-type bacteriocin biosynthesis protein